MKLAYNIPARAHSSAIIMAAPGSRSLGLSTSVFPVAAANGIVHKGIMAGKLNGAMLTST
jgi:hypothetical protein